MRGGRFSRLLAEAPIFGASYAALVFSFPEISFGVANVRAADALMGFIPRLGWGPILGLAIGCLIVNFASPIGLLDLFSVPIWTAGNIIILLLSRVRKWLGFIPSWLILTLWLSWLIGRFAGIPYPAMFMILAPQTFISDVTLPIIVMYAFEKFYPAVRRGRI